MLRKTVLSLMAITATVGMSACSSTAETPQTDTSSESPKPDQGNNDSPSAIDKPKDLKAVASPCDLLTAEQVAALGNTGKPKEETALSGEKKCTWSDSSFQMTITSIASLKRSAERMYQDAKTNGHPERFKVGGYPAANIINESEISTVELAVSKDQTFSVQFGNIGGDTGDKPEMADSQGYAKKIASEVLKNIPDA